jgi:pimeloyl-ACP methyl ester carboxylesterase
MTDQTKLRFIEQGQGEPIVLLYGLFGSAKNFDTTVHEFRQAYRVIIPVFPFYESGTRVDIFTMSSFLEDLINELDLEKVHLFGNSMGGHIALLYVLEHPEKITSLILSGSSGLYETGLGDTFPRRSDYEYIKTKTQKTFYKPEVATKELVDEVYATVNSHKAIQILSLAKSTIRNNLEKELHKIKVPCCLIWGKNDTITPPQVAQDFQRLIPHAQLHFIDECGHVPMMERPGEFNLLLHKFLDELNRND